MKILTFLFWNFRFALVLNRSGQVCLSLVRLRMWRPKSRRWIENRGKKSLRTILIILYWFSVVVTGRQEPPQVRKFLSVSLADGRCIYIVSSATELRSKLSVTAGGGGGCTDVESFAHKKGQSILTNLYVYIYMHTYLIRRAYAEIPGRPLIIHGPRTPSTIDISSVKLDYACIYNIRLVPSSNPPSPSSGSPPFDLCPRVTD